MTPVIARPRARRPALWWAFALSLLLHGALAGVLVAARPAAARPRPPSYRVNLVAAPTAAPAAGVVSATPAPATAPVAPPPVPKRTLAPKAAPVKSATPRTPPRSAATPVPPAAAVAAAVAPAAGAAEGGKGADVATVRTEGAEFPYPAYLENVVRQISLRFKPPRNTAARAEVMFVVRRDGSIVPNSLQFVSRSGNFAFDLEAQGAVEQAGAVKAFGPLPTGFSDDVLPVVFSFDPRVLH